MPRPNRQSSIVIGRAMLTGDEQRPLVRPPELLLVVGGGDRTGPIDDERRAGPATVGMPYRRTNDHDRAVLAGRNPQRVQARIDDRPVRVRDQVRCWLRGQNRRVVRREEQLRQHDDRGAGRRGLADEPRGGRDVRRNVTRHRLGLDGGDPDRIHARHRRTRPRRRLSQAVHTVCKTSMYLTRSMCAQSTS